MYKNNERKMFKKIKRADRDGWWAIKNKEFNYIKKMQS